MADTIIRFIGDPKDALNASQEVKEAIDSIQTSAKAAALETANIVPPGVQQGTENMLGLSKSTTLATSAMQMMGVRAQWLNGLLRMLSVSSGVLATQKTQLAGATAAYGVAGAAAGTQLIGFKGIMVALSGVTVAWSNMIKDASAKGQAFAKVQKTIKGVLNEIILSFKEGTKWAVKIGSVWGGAFKVVAASVKALLVTLGPLLLKLIAIVAVVWAIGKAFSWWQERSERLRAAQETLSRSTEEHTDRIKELRMEVIRLTDAEEYEEAVIRKSFQDRVAAARQANKEQKEAGDELLKQWKWNWYQHRDEVIRMNKEMNDEIVLATEVMVKEIEQIREARLAKEREAAEEIEQIQQETIERIVEAEEWKLSIFGKTEDEILRMRLKAEGATEAQINRGVESIKKRLALEQAELAVLEEQTKLHERAQMMSVTELYRRIQTSAATVQPAKQENRDSSLLQGQLSEQKRQTLLLERIERKPVGLN